jgi:hypothetical protein
LRRPHRLPLGLALALASLTALSWTAGSAATANAGVTASPGTLGFQIYHPPASLGGTGASEPSIGVDRVTNTTMYLAGLQTFAVKFDDSTTPATAMWKDVSFTTTSQQTLDPILFTDGDLGRTFVSQLTGLDSLSAYTDDDGGSYTPSQGGGIPSGVDHQSVGAGPYNPGGIPPQGTVYANAVYYCSQDVATAFCARSDTGGVNFGPGVPVYTFDQCGGLHGHVRVAPSGLVMLPDQDCDKQLDPGAGANQAANGGHFPFQAVVTSSNNGNPGSWTVQTIPDSHASLRSDPVVAADKSGRVYFTYEDAVTSSSGEQVGGRAKVATASADSSGTLTWSPSVDVGAVFGVQNVQFPEVIAGDNGRAAVAFLGSTTTGNPESVSFTGHWDLYVAVTTDAGANWSVSDLTPNDPVERGCTFLGGISATECPNPAKRNLYDFMDIAYDKDGRVQVGYADGCIGACAQGTGSACQSTDFPAQPQVCDSGPAASTSQFASIARLQCGPSLLAATDHRFDCAAPAQVPETRWVPALTLAALGLLAVPVVARRRRRGGRPAPS